MPSPRSDGKEDAQFDRTVAIKVVLSQFSQTAELRQRCEREARAISSLSHPHIWSLASFERLQLVVAVLIIRIDRHGFAVVLDR